MDPSSCDSSSALLEDLARAKKCMRRLESARPSKLLPKYEEGLLRLRRLVRALEQQVSENIVARNDRRRVERSLQVSEIKWKSHPGKFPVKLAMQSELWLLPSCSCPFWRSSGTGPSIVHHSGLCPPSLPSKARDPSSPCGHCPNSLTTGMQVGTHVYATSRSPTCSRYRRSG